MAHEAMFATPPRLLPPAAQFLYLAGSPPPLPPLVASSSAYTSSSFHSWHRPLPASHGPDRRRSTFSPLPVDQAALAASAGSILGVPRPGRGLAATPRPAYRTRARASPGLTAALRHSLIASLRRPPGSAHARRPAPIGGVTWASCGLRRMMRRADGQHDGAGASCVLQRSVRWGELRAPAARESG
jgi:hypothetical protein